MLKDHSQLNLSLSPCQGIYKAIIPTDHLLRKIKENIDFIYPAFKKFRKSMINGTWIKAL